MSKKSSLSRLGATTAALFLALSTASAVVLYPSITPVYDSFGPLPAATFGGSGIPNDSVAIDTYTKGGSTITLGLEAFQRYANPPVTDNGHGTYTALVGGDILDGQPTFARWNVGAYAAVTGSVSDFAGYFLRLYYDTNPGVGNGVNTFFDLPLPYNDSSNLGYVGALFAPNTNGVPFDPNAVGQYGFALALMKGPASSALEVSRTAILVNTIDSVPDAGTSMGLLFLGLTAVGIAKHRIGRPAPVRVPVRR